MSFLHWLAVHTGSTTVLQGPYYNFFSGVGSDLGEIAIIGGLLQFTRHANCHNRGCWRLSLHTTPDGYRLCKKHAGKSLSELSLHEIHSDHRSGQDSRVQRP